MSLKRSCAFTHRVLEDAPLDAAEISLHWDDYQGFECPDHPAAASRCGWGSPWTWAQWRR